MEKIKKESDPEKRRAMVARAQKELDEREKETKKLSKKIKKLKKSQKVSLGDVIAGIILILLLLYFFV